MMKKLQIKFVNGLLRREKNAAWYQHEELGYNYRMSNVVAGVVRGQFPYLDEHIAQKKCNLRKIQRRIKRSDQYP